MRKLLQGYLDVRADTEIRHEHVISPAGQTLNHVRTNTSRSIASLFGDVTVRRIGYNQRHQASLFPLDHALNLPKYQWPLFSWARHLRIFWPDAMHARLTADQFQINGSGIRIPNLD